MSIYPAILYVEDDPNSRTVMELLLGMHLKLERVMILEDSKYFVENVQALPFKPDIIFLDIHMKPINGFDMLKILRTFDYLDDVPIVALTASVMNEEIQQLRDVGFNGVIPKPIDIMSFPDTLQDLLDGVEVWRIMSR